MLRKPTLGRKKKQKSFDDDKHSAGGEEADGIEHGDVEAVRIAPGGGTLQGGRERAKSSATTGSGMGNARPRANTAGTYEADLPARHTRQQGDYYADDVDESRDGPIDTPGEPNAEQQPGATIHMPHPHLPSGHHHYDRPTWAKETWEDLKVGDFVRLHADESVPAGASLPLLQKTLDTTDHSYDP